MLTLIVVIKVLVIIIIVFYNAGSQWLHIDLNCLSCNFKIIIDPLNTIS